MLSQILVVVKLSIVALRDDSQARVCIKSLVVWKLAVIVLLQFEVFSDK